MSLVTITLALAGVAHAADATESDAASAPANYVVALLGTTLAYRPPHGAVRGFQHDVSPSLGYGRAITPSVALELDLGPTFSHGDYQSLSLVPAVVWAFSSRFYAAARFLVFVDPAFDIAPAPGLGVFHAFDSGVAVSLEMNAISLVTRGEPDLGLAVTAGVLYSF